MGAHHLHGAQCKLSLQNWRSTPVQLQGNQVLEKPLLRRAACFILCVWLPNVGAQSTALTWFSLLLKAFFWTQSIGLLPALLQKEKI